MKKFALTTLDAKDLEFNTLGALLHFLVKEKNSVRAHYTEFEFIKYGCGEFIIDYCYSDDRLIKCGYHTIIFKH